MRELLPDGVKQTFQALAIVGDVQQSEMRDAVGSARVEQDDGGGNRLLHENAVADRRKGLAAGLGLAARESLQRDHAGPAALQVGTSL